jgi:hypothetical protein
LSNPAIGGNAPAPTKSEAEPVLGD